MSGTTTEVSAAEVAPEPDLEEILPVPGEPFAIGAASGDPVLVRVNRLRTVEFLALMRAITRGVGPGLSALTLSDDQDEALGEMMGLLVMAIPEAGADFVEFVQVVTVPVGKNDQVRVQQELSNPELEDTLRIVEQVCVQEIGDLQALLGKAQSMWGRLTTMYRKVQKADG